MRDFRDAKAMARTLRAALAPKRHKITISESLELIARRLAWLIGILSRPRSARTLMVLPATFPRRGFRPPKAVQRLRFLASFREAGTLRLSRAEKHERAAPGVRLRFELGKVHPAPIA